MPAAPGIIYLRRNAAGLSWTSSPAPGFHCIVLSRQREGAEGSSLDVLLSVGLQWLDSPPRKCITKHRDRVSQKRKCGGQENISTGNKIFFLYLCFKTHGCFWGTWTQVLFPLTVGGKPLRNPVIFNSSDATPVSNYKPDCFSPFLTSRHTAQLDVSVGCKKNPKPPQLK